MGSVRGEVEDRKYRGGRAFEIRPAEAHFSHKLKTIKAKNTMNINLPQEHIILSSTFYITCICKSFAHLLQYFNWLESHRIFI